MFRHFYVIFSYNSSLSLYFNFTIPLNVITLVVARALYWYVNNLDPKPFFVYLFTCLFIYLFIPDNEDFRKTMENDDMVLSKRHSSFLSLIFIPNLLIYLTQLPDHFWSSRIFGNWIVQFWKARTKHWKIILFSYSAFKWIIHSAWFPLLK